MLKGILYWLQFKYHNSTNERKRLFLIRQGAEIGEGTRILSSTQCFSTEPYLVSVGIDSLISVNVLLVPHDGGVKVLNGYNNVGGGKYFTEPHDKMGRIRVGNNCFIGHSTIVLPGVTIGDNVIIGAGSVVTKNIPSDSVAAGVPARVICSLDEYYEKNLQKGTFYTTPKMTAKDKKYYLMNNVK